MVINMEHLSNGEWTLMNALWERQPATVAQLVHALAPETGWSKHTVMTMLSRLEQKGAVSLSLIHIFRIEHLTKTYGEKKAVDDLSLHIKPGEIFCFMP